MLLLLSAWLLQAQPAESLRITYELEITEGTRQVGARLVINQLNEDTFSIHCSKGTSGTLFTYWATTHRDSLYLPKSSLAFEGAAGAVFRLFPNGPELDRHQWMKLLRDQPPERLGAFSVADEAGWRLLRNREAALTIRWREKKRGMRSRYGKRTFQPGYRKGTRIVPLSDAHQYWE